MNVCVLYWLPTAVEAFFVAKAKILYCISLGRYTAPDSGRVHFSGFRSDVSGSYTGIAYTEGGFFCANVNQEIVIYERNLGYRVD